MSDNHRRMVGIIGMAAAGLLAPPLIALLASPAASADTSDAAVVTDITTYGPYTFDGFTDTLSVNPSTDLFDNYLTGALGAINLDLDIYSPATGDYDVLLTDPGLFQFGVDDTGGVFSFPIESFVPADFVDPDIGLSAIGGL